MKYRKFQFSLLLNPPTQHEKCCQSTTVHLAIESAHLLHYNKVEVCKTSVDQDHIIAVPTSWQVGIDVFRIDKPKQLVVYVGGVFEHFRFSVVFPQNFAF